MVPDIEYALKVLKEAKTHKESLIRYGHFKPEQGEQLLREISLLQTSISKIEQS